MRSLFFASLLVLSTLFAACGDDDYGEKLDNGQDLSVVDLTKHD